MATTKDAKLLRQTKFPVEFSQKVDMKKVNVEVMKKYDQIQDPFLPRAAADVLILQMDSWEDLGDPRQRRRCGDRALLQSTGAIAICKSPKQEIKQRLTSG